MSVFATVEYLFPKPVPFFRLGLANLPILLALDFLPLPLLGVVVLLKVLGQGLINGTLASYVFLFSLAGSLAAGVVMVVSHRLFRDRIGLVGISLFGALASNIVQVLLSIGFIFGAGSWVIAPLFLSLGSISGLVVGVIAERFRQRSRWLARIRSEVRAAREGDA